MLLIDQLKQLPLNFDSINQHCPDNRSPIYYTDVDYLLATTRGKRTTKRKFQVKKMVLKGTIEEIKKSKEMRKRVAIEHLGGGKEGFKKFNNDFNLSRIEITELKVKRFLGYGIK